MMWCFLSSKRYNFSGGTKWEKCAPLRVLNTYFPGKERVGQGEVNSWVLVVLPFSFLPPSLLPFFLQCKRFDRVNHLIRKRQHRRLLMLKKTASIGTNDHDQIPVLGDKARKQAWGQLWADVWDAYRRSRDWGDLWRWSGIWCVPGSSLHMNQAFRISGGNKGVGDRREQHEAESKLLIAMSLKDPG